MKNENIKELAFSPHVVFSFSTVSCHAHYYLSRH